MATAPEPAGHAGLRIAVDIGGTFTDLAAFNEDTGELHFGKALSTHGQLVNGIEDTLRGARIEAKDAYLFLHGSTIAINTLLERNGAETALLITEGFRDIYEIGRVNRPDAYNLFFSKHEPLIRRSLRFEVPERLRADGAVHKPLDEAAVRTLVRSLKDRGIQSVAVLLLHSYRNPAHETRVKEIVLEELPGTFVSASHELSQEYREFERVSTVAANAYVGPRVSAYLGELESHLEAAGFRGSFYAVQSTGGLFPSPMRAATACACWNRVLPRVSSAPRPSARRWASARPSPSTWAARRPRPASSATASRSRPAARSSAAMRRPCRSRSP